MISETLQDYSHVNEGLTLSELEIECIPKPSTLPTDFSPFLISDRLLNVNQLRFIISMGLAYGDCLGSSSEFFEPIRVNMILADKRYGHWPFELQGGGNLGWSVGEPTDDTNMAMGILRGLIAQTNNEQPVVDLSPVADEFLKWYKTNPKDIGNLTLKVCQYLENNFPRDDPFVAARTEYLHNSKSASNGSLMRNSVVAPLFYNNTERLIDTTVLQSCLTHYSPLCVLVCVVESLLIQYAMRHHLKELGYEDLEKAISDDYIASLIQGSDSVWQQWKSRKLLETDSPCKTWLTTVGSQLDEAESILISGLAGFKAFDPYSYNFAGISGYCVLTLKIALWALSWSFRSETENPYDEYNLKGRLPQWPFTAFPNSFHTSVAWAVLVGVDADTYGAVSGGLIAAFKPHQVSARLTQNLLVKQELQDLLL